MEQPNLILTKTDREILNSYMTLMDGLSNYLGSGYEFVLHSLENYERSVIKIINGFHTGRTVGAPITDLALSMLERIRSTGQTSGHVSYFSKNKKGEPLKSTTITVVGEGGRIIGLMCINRYLNTPLNEVLGDLMNFDQEQAPKANGADTSSSVSINNKETFAENIDDLITQSMTAVRREVTADTSIPANGKNREIVRRLNDMGIFGVKDAVAKVAAALNISKNTVYLHIRNMSAEK